MLNRSEFLLQVLLTAFHAALIVIGLAAVAHHTIRAKQALLGQEMGPGL